MGLDAPDETDTDGQREGAAELVQRAADGDHSAWDEIVSRYVALVWSITREHRLGEADGADVVQTTWLRLVENLDRLRDPAHVGAWLATTARRECLRTIAYRGRCTPTDDDAVWNRPDESATEPDAGLIGAERDAEVREVMHRLPPRWRELLELLMQDDAPSYEQVSALMGIPIGSIGPSRSRCLAKLRRHPAIAQLIDADAQPIA